MKKDIVVISLFDGLSGARLALEDTNLNVLRYYSSEIDKYALIVANHNYPQDTKYRLGDVTKIDTEALLAEIHKDFGVDVEILLIGGSPCFVKGTKVITETKYLNIEDISIGDRVLTHTGEYKNVLAIGSKLANTITVKAQGLKPTETTVNHPYYVRTMKRKWDNTTRSYIRTFSDPKWINAGDLTKGDFIGININTKSSNPLNLTKEECYILGRYIADGHTRKDFKTSEGRPNDRHWQLILSIGSNKVSQFCNNISDNNYSNYTHTKNVNRIVFSNKRLVKIAEQYCGVGAINKKIHQVLINLPKEYLSRLLDGYMDGGGSYRNGVYRATSISEELILTLAQVVAKVYRTNSSYHYAKIPKTCIIEGRTVNQHDTFTIEFRTKLKKQSKAVVIDDIIWLPFKESYQTGNTKQVYNIEVEDDNSYTANNAIVHNCQGFSMAGKMKGSSTKEGVDVVSLKQYLTLKDKEFQFDGQSYLFWEYIRIKEAINPKYWLLENVKVTKKWLFMFNSATGVEPIFINSKLVSAQSRPRFYWTNIANVRQPKDENILLKDILLKLPIDKYLTPFMSDEFDGVNRLDKGIFNFIDEPKGVCQTVGSGHGNKYLISRPCEMLPSKKNSTHVADAIDIKGNESIKRVYSKDGKSPTVTTQQGGHREVKVLVSECRYRKLTPLECERLQTLPDNITNILQPNGKPLISDTQRFKMIGNGFTIKVISHILNHI